MRKDSLEKSCIKKIKWTKKVVEKRNVMIELLKLFIYPIRLGVDGGVQGELPSLYEPLNEAPCLRRTAFNRFNVDMLNPCLNDCKQKWRIINWKKTQSIRVGDDNVENEEREKVLTEIDGPLISRKSILRNRSHSTSSSTDGYRLSGDSKIICSTSTTYQFAHVQTQLLFYQS